MEQVNTKDTKTVYLIKRVKTGKYLKHLFEDDLDISYSGTSPEDSYCYTYSLAFINLLIDERERTGEELESYGCILVNKMKQDRIELKQSKFLYPFKEAQELAEKWTREYNQYFTCLDRKMKYSLVTTGTWIVTNKFDPRVR